MMSEYNRLVKNYAVITGKDWVYLAKKVGDGGVKVDRTKMNTFMAAQKAANDKADMESYQNAPKDSIVDKNGKLKDPVLAAKVAAA